MPKEKKLMMFYGKECPDCQEVRERLEKLREQENIDVKEYEVWHDSNNQSLMMKFAEERCIGVPFLFNKETNEYICGAASYEKIKKWAEGKEMGEKVKE
ncbi:MAG: hypothetical protein ACOC8Y_04975 [Candidatus Natronoplasma sp.]